MRRSSLLTATAGLVGSLLISLAAYVLFDTLLVFLLVPFVPILFRSRTDRPPEGHCPECGFRTRDPDIAYCPRDGHPIERNGE
ncbi:MAG: hypothetical protein ABEH64_07765 [Salinirussus sp.]